MTAGAMATPVGARTDRVLDHDSKRALWRLGLIVPLLPIISIGLYQLTGWTAALYLTPFLVFVVIPIQDVAIGVDNGNLSEDAMAAIADSRYYRALVEAYVPLQYLAFGIAVWFFGRNDLSVPETIGLALSVGIVGGVAINAAHEMGHKSDRFQQRLARLALAQSAYGHFYVEHNRGHHRNVSTPEDPASSRYGESLWAFLPRTVVGSARSAWRLEADRLTRKDQRVFGRHNKNLQSWAITVVLFVAATAAAGVLVIPVLIAQALVGIFLLEAVNYLEHYGLKRRMLVSGRYEKCRPEHSWNSNHRVTNVFLYQLQRHSDHHANPTRPYQLLRNFDDAPNLPAGYATMILVASVPPLWFRMMNPRVAEVYGGDLSRANLSPRAARRLAAPRPA